MPALRAPDPPLSDGDILVRELRLDDVPALVAAVQDPLIRRFTARIPYPYGPEQAREWVALQPRLLAEGSGVHLALADAHAEPLLLGCVGLHEFDHAARTATMGYWLAPGARGRGVATRGVALLAAWAFSERALTRLGLHADVENLASQRVAERAGFVRAGLTREAIGGRERDAVAFVLDRPPADAARP